MVFWRKGGLAIESLLLLVVVLFTSAAVFYLVQTGIVSVEGSDSGSLDANSLENQFLNVEFLPIAKGGTLALQEFSLCYTGDISSDGLSCIVQRELFFAGDEVHFSYEVISSSYLGEIELTENYRLIGPNGEIILDVAEISDIEYEARADEEVELVYFHDYFILGDSAEPGEYTLELIITNTLINKEAVLYQKIIVE